MSVWRDLVGQEGVVVQLARASEAAAAVVAGHGAGAPVTPDPARAGQPAGRPVGPGAADHGSAEVPAHAEPSAMTHAWLFTGPPGSGRSTAARAFAAALLCRDAGCGECADCHTALAGTHADLDVVTTQLLSIRVDDARALVARAARHPAGGRWRVFLMEDADRLTESAANALLKAVEEPAPRTVWMLCAPAVHDVLPTIRSRCRLVELRTPRPDAVAEVLVRRDGVDPAMASFAAKASQGHIGRARRLARDEASRLRRREVLRLPVQLERLGDCVTAAANLVDAAVEDAAAATAELDARESEQLARALGVGTQGRAPTGAAVQLRQLEKDQKTRAKRLQRDAIDRALVDLASFYRDVLTTQLRTGVGLVNDEIRADITRVAERSTPEQTVRRIDAILDARTAIMNNVAPLLAVEAMAISLRSG